MIRLALLFLWGWPAAIVFAEPPAVEFNRDIRPILAEHCFHCHGRDAHQREAGLRLDVPEEALAERDGRFIIQPGDPAKSELWARVSSLDENLMMPPPSTKKPLSASQKELLRKWIEGGAAYQQHWAFEPVVRTAPPVAAASSPIRNPIDNFIAARLQAAGLTPQPEADKPTLIRRLAFALTGLPPSREEVEQFLQDESPQAYDSLVTRYLNSPHYGEELARHWLDVARYADTHGLHLDNERSMWAYRDWVVQAFNGNLPFDAFTTWQLAGDLLPEATLPQKLATGFHRCNVTTSEGGALVDEFLYRYAVDRTSTVIQTWMGLTGGCAVCHDHKYDPLSMREFYSLYAFFYSAADPAMDKNIIDTEPFLSLPTPAQQAALEQATREQQRARDALEQAAAKAPYQDPAAVTPPPEPVPVADVLFDDFFPGGVSVRNTSRNASLWVDDPSLDVPSGRRALKQSNSFFHEEVLQSNLRPLVLPEQGKLEVWLRLDPLAPAKAVALVLDGPGGPQRLRWGPESVLDSREQASDRFVDQGPLPAPGSWTLLSVSLEAAGFSGGQKLTSISLQESGGIAYWDALTFRGTRSPASDPFASLRAWWQGAGAKAAAEVPEALREALKAGPDKPLPEDLRARLQAYYLANVARPSDPTLAALRQTWEAAHTQQLAAQAAIPGSMVYTDLNPPREAFVMLRGSYDKPGEKVEPGVPAVFPGLQKSQPEGRATRLDLARWLLAAEHPLTARVTVNRFWQQLFGTGLVKTSYDFGTQGELPSHPELLDWLAVEFRERGWDVKELIRLMVTSAAFRRHSQVTSEVLRKDPENRLYARGPRIRLDAEQIRDNVLSVSGLLRREMGGPGVKPYQPPNIWEPVGYADSNTRYYLQDHGASLYRRSLYCFLKRTAPPPFMSNFDGPNREQFCTRRERSNTPLQALQLMNDVQHFEAARALAECALAEGGSTPHDRIGFLFRSVLARPPTADEQKLVREHLEVQRELFRAAPESAARAVRTGESPLRGAADDVELAAWTLVSNLLLNLDETLTRN